MDLGAVPLVDHHLLADGQRIAPRPVDHETGREARQQEREHHRHPLEDLLLNGIRLRRVELHLNPHGETHDERPRADMQEFRRGERQKAEQIENRSRIRPGQVMEPAEKRGMAHFDGDETPLLES